MNSLKIPEDRLGPFARTLLSSMFLLCLLAIPVLPAQAQEKRIYQTDQYGNIQYHKPAYTILKEGRIVEIDSIGNKQYHKPQYKNKDGSVYEADSEGTIQYYKPSLSIQADGKIFKKRSQWKYFTWRGAFRAEG